MAKALKYININDKSPTLEEVSASTINNYTGDGWVTVIEEIANSSSTSPDEYTLSENKEVLLFALQFELEQPVSGGVSGWQVYHKYFGVDTVNNTVNAIASVQTDTDAYVNNYGGKFATDVAPVYDAGTLKIKINWNGSKPSGCRWIVRLKNFGV